MKRCGSHPQVGDYKMVWVEVQSCAESLWEESRITNIETSRKYQWGLEAEEDVHKVPGHLHIKYGDNNQALGTKESSSLCKGKRENEQAPVIPSGWRSDMTSPELPTLVICRVAIANSHSLNFSCHKMWRWFLPAIWLYYSNQVSLFVHSEQVHKPSWTVFPSSNSKALKTRE